MRLIDADKLYPDCLTKTGRLAISQSQISEAPVVEYTFEEAFQKTVCENKLYCPARPKGEWIIDGHHRRCKNAVNTFVWQIEREMRYQATSALIAGQRCRKEIDCCVYI